jgi:hypothetical protein
MLKKKAKKKIKKIKKAVCKSFKKTMENIGTPIAKSKGII